MALEEGAASGSLDRLYVAFLQVFVYSSVWTAAALSSMVLFVAHALGLDADPGAQVVLPTVTLFVSCMFIYNVSRHSDPQALGRADPRRAPAPCPLAPRMIDCRRETPAP